MKHASIVTTLFLSVCFVFACAGLNAQTAPLQEQLCWNHDVNSSFLVTDKKTTYPDFLPRLPSKEDCERYSFQADDSLTMLSLFVDKKHIPPDLKKNLIAFRSPNDKPIMFLPNVMKRSKVPVRDGFVVCWSTTENPKTDSSP